MSPRSEAAATTLERAPRRAAADFVALTKPRILVMILVTTLVGYRVGLAGPADWARMVHVLVGTLLAAAGAMALNQYWERDTDAWMTRTRTRPLPEGRLQPPDALAFGTLLALAGVAYLLALVGARAAIVTAATVLLYVLAYTPLKRRSPLCTVVGAVPGALPPVIGWVAARDDFGAGAWVLFGILFLWQFPHTLAIGRLYREDYARAGLRVLAVLDVEGRRTERHIARSAAALLVMSLVPVVLGMAGSLYLAGAVTLGAMMIALGARAVRVPSPAAARHVLYGSLLYLPMLFGLLALDKL